MIGRKLVGQTLIYGLASLLINGSNFFLIPLYTHYMTPAEYGVLSSVNVFSTFVTAFLTFGLNGAVTRFYFEFEREKFKRFLFVIFWFQVLISLLIVLPFIAFDGLFLDRLFKNVSYEPYLKYGFWIGFTGIFSSIPLAFLQAESKALVYRIFTTASFLILTTLMILSIVYLKQGSLGGVRANFLSNSIMAVAYLFFILKLSRPNFEIRFIKIGLAFSLPLMVYAIFGTLTEISSKYFIERFISLSELGIFNVAQQISAIIMLLTNAVNMAWIPLFYAEAKKDETSELFTAFGKLFIFFLSSTCLILSLFSKELIGFLMDSEFQRSAEYIPLLLLGYIIGSGYWILIMNPLAFAKKTIYMPFLTVISGFASFSLNFFLIPRYGVFGAVLAMVLSYIILVGLAYVFFKQNSRIKYDFKSMNAMLIITTILFFISTFVVINNLFVNLFFKASVFIGYLALIQSFRIYSLAEIKAFFKNQFSV